MLYYYNFVKDLSVTVVTGHWKFEESFKKGDQIIKTKYGIMIAERFHNKESERIIGPKVEEFLNVDYLLKNKYIRKSKKCVDWRVK